MGYPFEHHYVQTNGIRLHVVQCGPSQGPLVILLHGFPEFWYSWRHQIQPLAEAGYRVWAPDQRGYNLSDKPLHIRDYQVATLAADVIGLLDAAGQSSAIVVGHDWGAVVTWWLSIKYPNRIRRAAILNVPHPRTLSRALRRTPSQLFKSWYVFFFQVPWLPERATRWRNWRVARSALRGTSRRGTFSGADLALYQQAWSQPRAMRSMINWYRAAFRFRSGLGKNARVRIPVRIIWGKRDAFLNSQLAQMSLEMCDHGQLTYLPSATHWVQHEEPAEVNRLLLEFFNEAHA
ncbi:alpha/beta fold hydrolase [Hymenobacter jejuensis]|uniref:Alpha/beta hydrolase n=1 Tax=Hymenobacter jejuensis TaxID=2502781 RepID=A0A5B7ZWX6_9BACT|nr:alpha/beta hydrolase [Hymenobacter jejuensis]QDA59460.1 alpha/beta hydrolase [Hymenobacter jejuensis]